MLRRNQIQRLKRRGSANRTRPTMPWSGITSTDRPTMNRCPPGGCPAPLTSRPVRGAQPVLIAITPPGSRWTTSPPTLGNAPWMIRRGRRGAESATLRRAAVGTGQASPVGAVDRLLQAAPLRGIPAAAPVEATKLAGAGGTKGSLDRAWTWRPRTRCSPRSTRSPPYSRRRCVRAAA